ncbi:MAG TPA: YhdP family protein [Steroidobacter sp.]|nr:YhdP family protein [Steroidobacter sp.]
MPPRIRTSLRWLLTGVLAVAASIGLLFAAFGVVVTRVPEYRVQVQDWLRERSGLLVEFRVLRARLRRYGPELVFDDAVVRTPDRTRVLATAKRGSIGFDLWRAMGEGRLSVGRFALYSPQIALIRTRQGRIQLLGQTALPERTDAEPFALEQLPMGRFDVENAVVAFRDEITGRGPWSLSGVDFKLTRTRHALRLGGSAKLPESLGRNLAFSATADGPLDQYETLASTFSIEGERLDLAGWADVLPDGWPAPETGAGSISISGALLGSKLTQLRAQVDVVNVAVAAPVIQSRGPEPPDPGSSLEALVAREPQRNASTLPQMISYERIAFKLDAQREDDEWRATLSDVDLARPHAPWRAAEIHARWRRKAGRLVQANLFADRVVLDGLWPLLAYLPESEFLARLRALNARGALEHVRASIDRPAGKPPRYYAKARLQDLAVDPVGKAPGLAGLSGDLEASQDGGRCRLAPQTFGFALPRWFRAPLAAEIDSGEIAWRAEPAGWTVQGADLRLHNQDGRAQARFAVSIPSDGGSPVLDISAHGEDLNVAAAARYIPAGRLGSRVMDWFDQAFVSGRAHAVEFIYKGPTGAFPFRRGEGEFRVQAQIEDAVFSYQPGWTAARDLRAAVEFRNQGMSIHATAANIGALRITDAKAEIKDFKDAALTIKAHAKGDVADGLNLLKTSPIAPKLGEQFAQLEGAGAMSADVRFFLPIRQMANHDIEVKARFARATARLTHLQAPVRQLTGVLTVRNALPVAADLKGQWLGGPVHVVITPEGRNGSVLTAQGRASAESLRASFHVPETIGLRGAADWRLTTGLALNGSDQPKRQLVHLESDTHGLAVDLPEPLAKSQNEARNLRVTLELDAAKSALLRASFGDVRSLIRLVRLNGEWALERGGLRADGAAPSLPDHSGLRIEGHIDRFVLDDWLALRRDGAAQGKRFPDYLHGANVQVHDFEAFGYEWADVRGLVQATPAGWRVDVRGAGAEGQILIPPELTGVQPLRATMERLSLQEAPEQGGSEGGGSDPRNLPALDVYISRLRIGSRTIGAVELKVSRAPQGLRLERASVMNAAVQADARGHWYATSAGQQSALDAQIVSSDVAATLRDLNYSDFLEAKHGEIRANLTWPGGLNDNILAQASGSISLSVEGGQIVTLQPGAGRVLGLFSIAALPRRLALDFSDLTDQGLAFDKIHGDFELRAGHAYTNNLLLSGPAAEIGVAGRTGLRSRDYDQTAVVTGNLGASLPVAGALAGGPAVGAALLLFSQVFKEPLKGITRGYYRITGPWDNPKVERIEESRAKAAAEQ